MVLRNVGIVSWKRCGVVLRVVCSKVLKILKGLEEVCDIEDDDFCVYGFGDVDEDVSGEFLFLVCGE